MAHHCRKAGIDLACFAYPHAIYRGLHVVVDTTPGHPAKPLKGVCVGIEQHLVGLQEVGTQDKGAAMAELEVRHLQLDALTLNDGPVLAPIELERLPRGKHQRHKRASPSGPCHLLLRLAPAPGKGRNPIIGPGITQRAQVRM